MSDLTGLESIMSTLDAQTHRTDPTLKNEIFHIVGAQFTLVALIDLGEMFVVAFVAVPQLLSDLLNASDLRRSASLKTSAGDNFSTDEKSAFVPLWTSAGLPDLAAAIASKD